MVLRRTFLKVTALGVAGCGTTSTSDAGLADAAEPGDGSSADAPQPRDSASPDTTLVDATASDVSPDASAPDGLAPTLSNFRITDAFPDRVYFDSSEAIAGTTTGGFVISNATIASVTVSPASRTGHFFVLDTALDYWDNRTVRYEGGSDLQDGEGNGVYPFRLHHVLNEMSEPDSPDLRYVSLTGDDSNDGTSEASAWRTITNAAARAVAGQTVWIKAGDYGRETAFLANDGTTAEPIKFIGYKTAIGDISGMYFDVEEGGLDAQEMPLLDGGDRYSGEAFVVTGRQNFMIENLQFTRYYKGINGNVEGGVHVRNCLAHTFGDPDDDFSGVAMHLKGDRVRVEGCVAMNACAVNFRIDGIGNLVSDCQSYCDESTETGMRASTDYYFAIRGSHNIIKNNFADRRGPLQHEGHGITMKDEDNPVQYNLFESCLIRNMQQAFEFTRDNADYNVVRNLIIENNPEYPGSEDGGVILQETSSFNVFENLIVRGTSEAVRLSNTTNNNQFINCLFVDNELFAINIRSGAPTNNAFKHCTIHNTRRMIHFNAGVVFDSSNQMLNCTVSGMSTLSSGMGSSAMVYSHCNFFGGLDVPDGEANISVDPLFTDVMSHDFSLLPDSALRDAGVNLSDVRVDFAGAQRVDGVYSIGAFERD